MAQHRPTESETAPPYALQNSRFGSETPSVEDDVDVWRYAILELHARNDDDEFSLVFLITLRCRENSCLIHVLGGCQVSANSDSSLQITAQFLGCDKTELNAALVSRVMQTPVGGRRGSSIKYIWGFCCFLWTSSWPIVVLLSDSNSCLHCVATVWFVCLYGDLYQSLFALKKAAHNA